MNVVTMNAFELHGYVISDYADYTKSFVRITDERVRRRVEQEMEQGLLWPEQLLQLNPAFQPGITIDEMIEQKVLHEDSTQFKCKSRWISRIESKS